MVCIYQDTFIRATLEIMEWESWLAADYCGKTGERKGVIGYTQIYYFSPNNCIRYN